MLEHHLRAFQEAFSWRMENKIVLLLWRNHSGSHGETQKVHASRRPIYTQSSNRRSKSAVEKVLGKMWDRIYGKLLGMRLEAVPLWWAVVSVI